MSANSIHDPHFIHAGEIILQASGKLLALVRYPYQAGNRDFFMFETKAQFFAFLEARKPKEAVSLFKSFQLVLKGLVDENFILKKAAILKKIDTIDWLVLGDSQEVTSECNFVTDRIELQQELFSRLGEEVIILEEPDWISEESTITAYSPDEDGIVRPGAY